MEMNSNEIIELTRQIFLLMMFVFITRYFSID